MKKRIFTLISVLALAMTAWGATTQDSILALIPKGDEVYRYGYQQLSDEEKAIYNYCIEQIAQFEPNQAASIYHRVDLDLSWCEQPQTIYTVMYMLERVYRDVPELYLLNTTPRGSGTNYYARVLMTYTPSSYLKELTRIDSICQAITAPVTPDMSDYEKLKVIHDGFIDWADYGGMSSAYSGNIKGAFLEKRAVCEGFSRAFLMLCQRVGVPCLYVSGSLLTDPENDVWGSHAWNYVFLEGKWYLVDITTDGAFPGMCGYSAFLKGQDYFQANYKLTLSSGADENTANGVYNALPTISPSDYAVKTEVEEVEAEPILLYVDHGVMTIHAKEGSQVEYLLYDMGGRLMNHGFVAGFGEVPVSSIPSIAVVKVNGQVVKKSLLLE